MTLCHWHRIHSPVFHVSIQTDWLEHDFICRSSWCLLSCLFGSASCQLFLTSTYQVNYLWLLFRLLSFLGLCLGVFSWGAPPVFGNLHHILTHDTWLDPFLRVIAKPPTCFDSVFVLRFGLALGPTWKIRSCPSTGESLTFEATRGVCIA